MLFSVFPCLHHNKVMQFLNFADPLLFVWQVLTSLTVSVSFEFLWLILSIKNLPQEFVYNYSLHRRCYTKKIALLFILTSGLPKWQIIAASCHTCIICQYIMKHRLKFIWFQSNKNMAIRSFVKLKKNPAFYCYNQQVSNA